MISDLTSIMDPLPMIINFHLDNMILIYNLTRLYDIFKLAFNKTV